MAQQLSLAGHFAHGHLAESCVTRMALDRLTYLQPQWQDVDLDEYISTKVDVPIRRAGTFQAIDIFRSIKYIHVNRQSRYEMTAIKVSRDRGRPLEVTVVFPPAGGAGNGAQRVIEIPAGAVLNGPFKKLIIHGASPIKASVVVRVLRTIKGIQPVKWSIWSDDTVNAVPFELFAIRAGFKMVTPDNQLLDNKRNAATFSFTPLNNKPVSFTMLPDCELRLVHYRPIKAASNLINNKQYVYSRIEHVDHKDAHGNITHRVWTISGPTRLTHVQVVSRLFADGAAVVPNPNMGVRPYGPGGANDAYTFVARFGAADDKWPLGLQLPGARFGTPGNVRWPVNRALYEPVNVMQLVNTWMPYRVRRYQPREGHVHPRFPEPCTDVQVDGGQYGYGSRHVDPNIRPTDDGANCWNPGLALLIRHVSF